MDLSGDITTPPAAVAAAGPAKRRPRTLKNASADALPCDLEAEKSVISAILLDGTSMNLAASSLGTITGAQTSGPKKEDAGRSSFFHHIASTMFRDPVYSQIYEAMLALFENNISIDVLSVSDWLRRAEKLDMVGGTPALLELQGYVVNTSHLESWCLLLKDFAMLREMIRTCSGALDFCRAGSDDVKSILDKVEAQIFNVRNKFVQPEIVTLKDTLVGTVQNLLNIANRTVPPGIPTEFPDLDKLIGGGLKPGEMFVLAARPSIGKTALALNIIRNVIMKDAGGKRKSVAFFSLEMTADQIVQRLLSTESKIPLSSFYDGSFQDADLPRLTQAADNLRRAKLFIDATSGISVFELRAKARKLKELSGIDLIVIDYLQLMKAGDREKESRQVEVAAISGGLKSIAKELSIPVLVLAQLSRESEKAAGPKQENPMPKLSHLRESGAIEQDADVVTFLHRNRDEAKENNGAQKDGLDSYLIVEKNRNGRTGTIKIKFVPALMEFQCVDHKYSTDDVPKKVEG